MRSRWHSLSTYLFVGLSVIVLGVAATYFTSDPADAAKRAEHYVALLGVVVIAYPAFRASMIGVKIWSYERGAEATDETQKTVDKPTASPTQTWLAHVPSEPFREVLGQAIQKLRQRRDRWGPIEAFVLTLGTSLAALSEIFAIIGG